MRVIATAGHVDHGKSTLVHALTGIDPDRFSEEKARGLTIDLGFAWTVLPSGAEVAFVDVPGHVRFIKNMLAGVGSVDACLFVVAATEGWKPQSEEHLRILELLGVARGMVALTKVGLVDDERRDLALAGVAEHVCGSFLEGAPVVPVDAPAGTGLGELGRCSKGWWPRRRSGPTGVGRGCGSTAASPCAVAGTVVTGTLTGGSLAVARRAGCRTRATSGPRAGRGPGPGPADPQTLVADGGPGPAGRRYPGSARPHTALARGQALVRPRQWAPTTTVDASLQVLPSLDHEVSRRGAYQAYFGSSQEAVALRILGPNARCPVSAAWSGSISRSRWP